MSDQTTSHSFDIMGTIDGHLDGQLTEMDPFNDFIIEHNLKRVVERFQGNLVYKYHDDDLTIRAYKFKLPDQPWHRIIFVPFDRDKDLEEYIQDMMTNENMTRAEVIHDRNVDTLKRPNQKPSVGDAARDQYVAERMREGLTQLESMDLYYLGDS